MYLVGFLVVGVAVGFLAGYVMTGHGYGIFWDMVVGAVGAVVAGLVLSLISGAALAAVVLVAVLHLAYGRERPRAARP